MPPKIHDPSLKDSTLWQLLNKGQAIDKKYRKSVGNPYGTANPHQVSPDQNITPSPSDGQGLQLGGDARNARGTTGQEADRTGQAGSQALASAPPRGTRCTRRAVAAAPSRRLLLTAEVYPRLVPGPLEAGAGKQNAVMVVRRYAGFVADVGLFSCFTHFPAMKMTTK
jgi:hypothetical protein